MIATEYILLGVAVLLLLSIVASKASGRLGVPSLLIFLGVGVLAGSEGIGRIPFDDPYVAQFLGVVALVFILFAGGLGTAWESVRQVIGKGIALSTLGVFVTAVLVGAFAAGVLGFSLLEGLLLGAIVSSTDAAAVFAVLRARSVSLKGQIKPLLELESGSNDPMAVFLTVGLTGLLVNRNSSLLGLIPVFFQQMALGAFFGYGMGRAMVFHPQPHQVGIRRSLPRLHSRFGRPHLRRDRIARRQRLFSCIYCRASDEQQRLHP